MRSSAERHSPRWARDALAATFLLALLAAGSLALWTAVPAASLWAAGKLARSKAEHFLIGLPLTLAAMAVWGTLLIWINALYLRVTGFWEAFEDPDEPPRRLRGPLESLLVGSLYLAVVAFLIWFFAFARNPQPDIAF